MADVLSGAYYDPLQVVGSGQSDPEGGYQPPDIGQWVTVATPDPYGGNPVLTSLPWGVGAQDMTAGQPGNVQDSSAVLTSKADVLRPSPTPDGSPLIAYGQTPYVAPADPTMATTGIDWSQLGDVFKGMTSIFGSIAPVLSGSHASLAGVRAPGVGNPAPGGQPAAGLLQFTAPGGRQVSLNSQSLVLYAVIGAVVYFVFLRRRAR